MTFDYRTQYAEYRKYVDRLMKEAQSPIAQASFALVGTFLFSAFLLIAALRPTIITIASLVQNIADERKIVATLDKKIQALGIAQQKLEEVRTRLKPADTAIPSDISIEEFTKELEILAQERGVTFFEANQRGFPLFDAAIPTPAAGQIPRVSDIPVHVVVGGSEASVRAFLSDLEHLDRLVVVTNASLTGVNPQERKERPYALSADIAIQIFTTQPLAGKGAKKPAASPEAGENRL